MNEFMYSPEVMRQYQVPSIYICRLLDVLNDMTSKEFVSALFEKFSFLELNLDELNLSIEQVLQIVDVVAAEKKYSGIGYYLGRSMPITVHGPISNILISASSLREALPLFLRYGKSRLPFGEYEMTYQETSVEIMCSLLLPIPANSRSFLIDMSIGATEKVCEFYTGLKNNIRSVSLARDGLSKTVFVEDMASCMSISCGAKKDKVVIDNSVLDCKNEFASKELFSHAIEYCDALFDREYQNSPFTRRVTDMVLKEPAAPWTLASAAERMHITPATLKAKLAKEDESVRKIVARIRTELAKQWLSNTSYTINEVAYFLGYNEASNFSASFKEWTGVSPSEFKLSRQN